MKLLKPIFLAGAFALAGIATGFAQSASTVGSGATSTGPSGSSAAGGTGGSAAAGGTSASTLGLGATTTGPAGTASSLGLGGSAGGGARDTSSTKIHGNEDHLNGTSRARAQDGGTWSKSMTHTRDHRGDVTSRTKSMSHVPGGPPAKSTTTLDTGQ